MADNRILFVSQEIAPYVPANDASTLGNELPRKAQSNGFEVRTFMPRFGSINERRNQLHEVIRLSGLNISIDDTDHPLIIKVASLQPSRIQVYFIDNDDYFQRLESDVDPVGSDRVDNDERAIFFARGTMETVKKLRWEPSVIQCSGWITALTPMYLRRMFADDPSLSGSKTIYTVTPGKLQAPLDPKLLDKLKADGMPAKDIKRFKAVPDDVDKLHLLAIEYSDGVIINDPDANPAIFEAAKRLKLPVLPYEEAQKGPEAQIEFFKSFIKDEK